MVMVVSPCGRLLGGGGVVGARVGPGKFLKYQKYFFHRVRGLFSPYMVHFSPCGGISSTYGGLIHLFTMWGLIMFLGACPLLKNSAGYMSTVCI